MSALTVDELVRRHPRERLFVQPLEWTGRHLQLLACVFEPRSDVVPGDGGERPLDSGPVDPRPFDYWTHEAESLAASETKNAVIRRILTERDGPFKCIRPFGYFHFGAHDSFRLHGLVFAPRSQRQVPPQDRAPVFAFMQRGMIKYQRGTVFPMPRPRRREHRLNAPVAAQQQLHLKLLEPADPCRDPYILAVLLGLAQAQAKKVADEGTDRRGHEYRVCAVLVDETDTEDMQFYSAGISAAFLGKFGYPENLEVPEKALSASLTIRYAKFPYKPYSSLRQRLFDAINLNSTSKRH
ncbi:hypothetical protein AK830_g9375 [Neonectria ditissima]|uniref:Uncharacterized protein n=1 Tax=Neonectria ditissima TaxID=78410 RepID=A0A0P7B9L0_9HYPO|nr:hypothetical protein AK830_g9375 [Neonectria ditissima]